MSFYRGSNSAAFDSADREVISRIAPHLLLAFKTFRNVKALSLTNSALTQTLDAVTTSIIIVNRAGCVIFENDAARSVLRRGNCLCVIDGLLAPSPQLRDPLTCRHALHNLRLGRASTVHCHVGRSGERLILSMAPMSDTSGVFAPWGAGAGLVWLTSASPTVNAAKRVASVFALTGAEERLLGLLAAGHSLGDAARSLHVSIHTTRTQLKSLQHKTGWHTQTELVRMVLQINAIDARTATGGPGNS